MEVSPATKVTGDVDKQTVKIKEPSVRIVLHLIFSLIYHNAKILTYLQI